MAKYIIIFSFLAIVFDVQAQLNLTLDDCINSAKIHSPLAVKKTLANDFSNLQIQLLNRNYIPQSSLNGQATWQSDVTGIPIEFPGIQIPEVPKDQYRATLDIQQILWDGGKTSAQKSLQLLSANTQIAGIEVEEYKLVAIIQNLFFGAMLYQEQEVALNILFKELEKNRGRILVSIENGVAINNDLRYLEVKIAETEQKILEAEKRYQSAIQSLGIWIGQELDQNTALINPVLSMKSGNELNRPEIRLFETKAELLNLNEQLIGIKHRPTLSAFGTLGYGQPGLNFLTDGFNSYALFGARLRIPLSTLYNQQKSLERQQVKIQLAQNEQDLKHFEQNISAIVIKQEMEIDRLTEIIKKDQEIIDLRENIKEVAYSQYENGVITINDYLTEVSNESAAIQNKILHEIQLLQSEHQLLYIQGY